MHVFWLQIVPWQQHMPPFVTGDASSQYVPRMWGALRVFPALPHEHPLGVGEFAASEFDEATSAASEGVNATAAMAMAILTSCIFCVLELRRLGPLGVCTHPSIFESAAKVRRKCTTRALEPPHHWIPTGTYAAGHEAALGCTDVFPAACSSQPHRAARRPRAPPRARPAATCCCRPSLGRRLALSRGRAALAHNSISGAPTPGGACYRRADEPRSGATHPKPSPPPPPSLDSRDSALCESVRLCETL